MIRCLLICAALWVAPGALLALCVCIVRARDNARVRAVRRQMRAELIAQLRIDHEFDLIVAQLKEDHA